VFGLVALLVVSIVTAGIVSADSRGEPVLTAHLPDDTVTPGEETTLTLFVLNGGDVAYADSAAGRSRVTTARNVRLRLASDRAPVTVETATTPVGSIPEGISSPVGFDISVDDDAEPGTYDLPLRVEYRYTHRISGTASQVYEDRERTETLHVTVEVERDARFEVVSTTADDFSDGTGSVALRIENVGRAPARDARLTVASETTGLTFGGSRTADTFAGDWQPGEVREFRFEGDLAQRADRRPYLFTARVDYESDGETRASETLFAGATPGSRGSRFTVTDAQSDLAVGDTGTLSVTVRNTGDEPVRDARLALTSSDPKLTFAGPSSASTYVGKLPAGGNATVAVAARIADGADVRPYPLSATATFVDASGDTRRSDPIVTAVAPEPRAGQFAVVNSTADVAAGEGGPVTLRVENTGETVRDARLVTTSEDPGLTFSGAQTASTFVGTWAAGEVRTFVYTADMADRADVRSYPVSASVTYRTADGETRRSDPSITGVVPRVNRLAIEDVESTLAVGAEGTLRGALVNTGETPVRNAVVVFETTNPNVHPVETEYSVGTLAPGERASFSFDAEISDTANGGPRQFSVRVRYRDANDDVRRSDSIDLDATVGAKRDVFAVSAVDATFDPGESGALRVEVTNRGNQTFTDVSAKLFTDDPLSSSDDEAYVEALAPGESTTMTFDVAVGSGAMAKEYPVDLDVQYDDADGDTLLSDTYTVPVTVPERSDEGPFSLAVVGGVGLLLVVGGVGWWHRTSIGRLFH
jgi:hypothetical protein